MEPPEFTNWQDAWEWHAQQTSNTLYDLSEDELLELLEARHFDAYYSLWSVVKAKCTPQKAALPLLAILTEYPDDLVRYHCADALFGLLGLEHLVELRQDAQWEHGARPEALAYLAKLVEKTLSQLAVQSERETKMLAEELPQRDDAADE